jgi:hypothetical protein
MTTRLRNDLRLGYRIERAISAEGDTRAFLIDTVKDTLQQSAIDEVLVILPTDRYASEIRKIVDLCERQGILLRLETQ